MSFHSLFLGALRTRAPTFRPPTHSLLQRSLFTSAPILFSLHTHPLPRRPLLLPHSRALSLSSIFSRKPPVPTPPPSVVANVAAIEAEANANPTDPQKQISLFQALVGTKIKPGYDVVIARWEHMCDFDPSNPLLRSDIAFQLYLTALVENGLSSSVDAAVQKRDSLLGVHAAASTSTSSSASSSSLATSSDSVGSSDAATSPAATDSAVSSDSVSSQQPAQRAPTPTSSQLLAQAVLTRQAALSVGGSAANKAGMANFATALNGGLGVPDNPVVVTINEPKGSWVPRMIRFLVLTAVTSFFLLVMLAVLLENSGLMKAGPHQSEFEPVQGKTYKFNDVHGVDEAKDELQEVVEFLKDPTSFAALGGKLPKGILLTGPPGTGKTMLARSVAGEAGVPFFFASGSEFDEMFVGVGAKRVRDLFAAARKRQPAIIFIDEIDAIGGKRSNRDTQYMKQTLNQLLVEMDGFLQTEGVIVIAATNFPDSLDPALVRPGRFDRHIAVPLPDVRGRVQILKHHMKDVVVAPNVDATILARGTAGFSGADLQNMVNQAAVQASKQGAKAVDLSHFEWAKDRIILGSERKSTYISEEVKKMTAYHEGGHALVALYTDGAMPLHKVTCVPRGHALGITSQLPQDDQYSVSLKEYLARIDVCMGGRVAEELIYGPSNVTSGASSDLMQATRTAQAMVKNWGFSDKVGPVYYTENETISTTTRDKIDSEVRKLLIAGESRVTDLLKGKEQELHRLASALVEHETLDADEVRKVIKGEPIRNIAEVLQDDVSLMSETVGQKS
ncbi:Mitochondrial inner membrane i-AAA protease supercomplex subunit YME1 [Sparassis crispa]|uniref:Mitochondrial inner membrane i-AAA protease supercomplex subunit YME1 n=1 Tax=Sparassis crispa TaxID=139825 RepID=A0A401GJA5_9APHY|nr:Mitochondrial inner membrane i-AAA protease supercomplex subunit YME1 [Sparassis crispa]GBE82242.1 Mitochondrial inner membrane i-AAA protease supercomplex subunit YME1 [Sparassis crispa]